MVKHLSDEQLQEADARRPRPDQGLRRLQGRGGAQGRADGDPGPHDQGLRAGRSRRRQEHHAPAEEAERRRAAGVPRPLRHSGLRRRDCAKRRSTVRTRTARRSSTCTSAARRSAASLPIREHASPSRSTLRRNELFEEFYKGTGGRTASTTMVFVRLLSKLLRDKEIGQADRADRAGRSAHLRHGSAVPAGRHLLPRRPALRAGRHGHAPLLQGIDRRPDSRRRHHRGRLACRRSSPPAPPTRRTASTRSRSSSITRCSASSASAI